MPKIDFLDPQKAEKINKQKRKQFWWTPCIVAYFQNQISKTKNFTKLVEKSLSQAGVGLSYAKVGLIC